MKQSWILINPDIDDKINLIVEEYEYKNKKKKVGIEDKKESILF